MTVHGGRLTPRELRSARLTGPVASVPAATTRSWGGGLQSWTFRLTAARFGVQRPLPLGGYTVRFDRDGTEQRLRVDPYAELALPAQADVAAHRVSAGIGPDGTLRVALQPALRADERGEWARQRLIELPPTPLLTARSAVLFSGTDGPARTALVTVADEIRRTRPDLTVYWEIADPAAEIPAGGIPVLSGTRAWYDLTAQAAVLCSGRTVERSSTTIATEQRRLLVLADDDAAGGTGRRSTAKITIATWPHLLTADPGLADRLRGAGYTGSMLVGQLPVAGLPGESESAQVRDRTRRTLGLSAADRVALLAIGPEVAASALDDVLASLPEGGRLVVWSPHRRRLPDRLDLVDASGWLRPSELLLAADDVLLPAGPVDPVWRLVDPDAGDAWGRLGVPLRPNLCWPPVRTW